MLVGPAWCFTINGFSFLAVIAALLLMNLKPRELPEQKTSALSSVKEGLRYVFKDPVIRPLMLIVSITTLFGVSFITIMPAWAVTILGGDATTNGLLQSARGVGAVLSALVVASLGRFQYKGKLLTAGTVFLPVVLLFFAMVRRLPLSLLMMLCVGLSMLLIMNMANALLQTIVPDHLRGRVMSIYSLTHFGFMPIGGLLAGSLAEYIGEPTTVVLSAGVCFCCYALIWVFVPIIRRLE